MMKKKIILKMTTLSQVWLEKDTPLPVQFKRFWACSKNKENIQLVSRDFFKQKSSADPVKIILSGFVTDVEGIHPCLEVNRGDVVHRADLDSSVEEADGRIISHTAKAIEDGCKRIVVYSNDADVVVYLLHYMFDYFRLGAIEVWMRYGTGTNKRYIPIHTLAKTLGESKSKAAVKAHILTGCDATSKIGTKTSALKKNPEIYLQMFGEEEFGDTSFKQAEKYLVQVVETGSKCSSFDDLRYHMYINKRKSIPELPPTSRSLRGHLERCYYLICLCSTLLDPNSFQLNPCRHGWESVNSVMCPKKYRLAMPEQYTVTCGCKSGACGGRCSCKAKEEHCIEYCKCEARCNQA